MAFSKNPTDQILLEAAKAGPAAYYQAVISATRLVHERLSAIDRLSATLIGNDVARLKELLSASLVLNDDTAIVFNAAGDLKVHVPEPARFPEMFGCNAIRFDLTQEQIALYNIDISNPSLAPCFVYSESSAQQPLLNALQPFIERGAVVFRPSRAVIAKQGKPHSWQIIGVPDGQRLDLWTPVSPELSVDPTLMEIQGPGGGESGRTLFEVTLPFIKGVPFKELAKLLADEEDAVLAFRSAVRSAVREASKSNAPPSDIANDLVKPRLLTIDRKLRSLLRVHGLKVGGAALSSIALAFTSASTGSVVGGLLGIAAAGGFGFATNQYADYLAKRDEVHQDPYYFLWRLRRRKK